MKSHLILKSALIAAMLAIVAIVLHSCKTPEPSLPTPTITSFGVSGTTMTTADFTYKVSNADKLTISIDNGSPINVSGTSYQATNLVANKTYTATLTAANAVKSASKTISFTTAKSNLAITGFTVNSITATTATFNFASTTNAAFVSQTLTNSVTKEVIDVINQTSKVVSNLNPSTNYTFTYTVKDNTGNEVSAVQSFTTLAKPSAWMSEPQVVYGTQFAIIGNALSNPLTIIINNTSSSAKTFTSLTANFGANGNAVKMLRYSLNGGAWNVLSAANGVITFSNITLQPGVNTFNCYFALKANVGVANGSALSFAFTALNDGDNAQLPASGTFQSAVSVGTVNANTQATVFLTDWLGTMSKPNTIVPPTVQGRDPIYYIQNLKMKGPGNARWGSIRLKDPYTAFNKISWDNNSWSINVMGAPDIYFMSASWDNNYVSIYFPNGNTIITDGSTFNRCTVKISYQNIGSTTFNSDNYTPDLMGFALTSKYDLVIYNSDNQIIDVSDAVIRQDGVVLNN